MGEAVRIRKMKPGDEETVREMMRVFYDSPALLSKVPDRVIEKDIEDAIGDNPYLDGWIFEKGGEIAGYSMTARCYATEYGGECIWVEDLYLKEKFRHTGIGSLFFDKLPGLYPKAVRFKLEVEKENASAFAAYEKNGYQVSGYLTMTKEIS